MLFMVIEHFKGWKAGRMVRIVKVPEIRQEQT
jgi:hypothetical protein